MTSTESHSVNRIGSHCEDLHSSLVKQRDANGSVQDLQSIWQKLKFFLHDYVRMMKDSEKFLSRTVKFFS